MLQPVEKFGDYKQHIYAEQDLTETLEELIDDESKVFQGNCTIPFHFQLPESLPSSVESIFGSTKYICKVEFIDILHSPHHQIHSQSPHHHNHRHQERPQVLEFPFTVLARIPGNKKIEKFEKFFKSKFKFKIKFFIKIFKFPVNFSRKYSAFGTSDDPRRIDGNFRMFPVGRCNFCSTFASERRIYSGRNFKCVGLHRKSNFETYCPRDRNRVDAGHSFLRQRFA